MPAIPAAIIPVGLAAAPFATLELAVDPPAAVAEVDPVVDIPLVVILPLVPVLLAPEPVAVAAEFALLVALLNSAAAVAIPPNPV